MPQTDPAVQNRAEMLTQFLQSVRASIPLTIEQIDMMLRIIDAACEGVQTFLDLGSGDAVLSSAILGEHRDARGTLVDLDAVPAAAREQLRPFADRCRFVSADFTQPDWETRLPGAPFDVIVSAFATHCLSDARKHQLYAELFALLKPEGLLINFEHVASATRWTQSVLDDYMIDAIFGEELRDQKPRPRVEVAREYYERVSREGEAHAPLEVQCDWLRDIGFESVECFFKFHELAMFGGQKPA